MTMYTKHKKVMRYSKILQPLGVKTVINYHVGMRKLEIDWNTQGRI